MTSKVVLQPHDRDWASAADAEIERLLAASSALVAVHHIGSTAIAGIRAKPIIDLLGVAKDLSSLDRQRSAIETLGYDWRDEHGMSGRRYCRLSDSAGRRLFHLHCYSDGDAAIKRHLAFRDHLLAHPDVAVAYEQVKLRCTRLNLVQGGSYAQCKGDWIRRAEVEALSEL